MRGTERIVDEDIPQRRQFFRKTRVILGLLLAESDVFQKHNIAVRERRCCLLYVLVHHAIRCGENHLFAQKLRKSVCYRLQSEFLFRFALRSSHMGHQNDLRAMLCQISDRRQCRYDTSIIGNLSLLHRYVEIASDEDTLSFYIHIPDCLFHKSLLLFLCLCTEVHILEERRFIHNQFDAYISAYEEDCWNNRIRCHSRRSI